MAGWMPWWRGPSRRKGGLSSTAPCGNIGLPWNSRDGPLNKERKMRFFWLGLFFLPLFVSAGGPQGETAGAKPKAMPKVVMAKVGDEEITVEDFMRFISKDASRVRLAVDPRGKAKLLRQMIADRLLKKAVEKEGLLPENPTPRDYQEAFKKLEAKHFPLPPPPSDEEAYRYYLEHKDQFGIPEMVRVSQILFRVPKGASKEEREKVRKKAEEVLKRLEAGEPFEKLAAEFTENPMGKVTHGDLGFLPRKGDPWLEKALDDLKVGEHTGVIESPAGYEILMITDRREGMVAPFPNVKNQVIQRMRLEKRQEAFRAYLKELEKTFPVVIEMEDLKDAMP
ncbi:MAG: peptidylprolyl isomerase [Gammaproteobacteria bacterium]|nr:MAG: peptidylprolyl isomerase [Gammaproteobacteria bacterium]